jgi:NitT/TauT family transport system substrate-binding protein
VIQSFTNAIYRGQLWVASHSPREVAEAIAPFFPDNDIDLLEKVCKRHADIDAFMGNPLLKPESLDRLMMVMEQAGELTQRVNYEDIVDPSFAQNAIENIK